MSSFTPVVKTELTSWLEKKLIEIQGEADATLLDYIMTMVVNEKSAADMTADLVDFIAEDDCRALMIRCKFITDLNFTYIFNFQKSINLL